MPTDECRCPDPVGCCERQLSYEQSGDPACIYCPVASWITAMLLSDRSMGHSSGAEEPVAAQWFDDSLERIGNTFRSTEYAELELLQAA